VIGQFYGQHYHQPSDDLSLPINYDAGASFIEVTSVIGQVITDSKSRPLWHDGDFFGDIFTKSRQWFLRHFLPYIEQIMNMVSENH